MAIEFYNRNWRVPSSWSGTEDNNNKVSNYSMSFDGSSEYIDVGLIDITSSKTLSIWFKSSNISSNQGLFEIMPDPNTSDFLIVWIYNSKILVSSNGVASDSKESSVLSSNTWYNLIITKSSGIIDNIYINGLNDTQSTSSTLGFVGGRGNAYIGATYQGTAYANEFNGQIDQVAIFDYSLSASQVTELYGSSTTGVGNPMAITNGRKPVAYYPLGDYSSYNGTEYLVANSALSDFVFDFNQDGFIDLGTGLGNLLGDSYTDDLTFSAWIKVPSSSNPQNGIFVIDSSGPPEFALLFLSNNQVWLEAGGNNIARFTSTGIDDNKWHHLVIVYDNDNATNTKLYFDNSPATKTTISSQPSALNFNGDNTVIGTYYDSRTSFRMTAQLSNAQVWNTALTSTEVETLYNYGTPYTGTQPQASNLQGFWKLDAGSTFDGSNFTVPDESSNSNSGTSSGMTAANLVQSNLNILSPYSRYALNFDSASSDYVDAGSTSFLNNATQMSFSVWFNLDTAAQNKGVVDDQDKHFAIYTKTVSGNNYSLRINLNGSANRFQLTGTPLTEGKWHNLVMTFNAGTLNFYIDGNSASYTVYSGSIPSALADNTGVLDIGRYSTLYWDGKISNPSIWNAALTSAQVTEIYNEGKPSNLKNHSSYSNLISWWTLGENSSFNSNWTFLNEVSTASNGTSVNINESALTNGPSTTANGVSSGMGGADNIVGDAPQNSTGNSLSYGMGVDAKSTDVPS